LPPEMAGDVVELVAVVAPWRLPTGSDAMGGGQTIEAPPEEL
jgi:hypothetical protein